MSEGSQGEVRQVRNIEGQRRGSIVYIFDDQAYVKDRQYNDKLHVRCHLFKSVCLGRGHIILENSTMMLTKDHNHGSQASYIEQMELKSSMKDSMKNDPTQNTRQVVPYLLSSFYLVSPPLTVPPSLLLSLYLHPSLYLPDSSCHCTSTPHCTSQPPPLTLCLLSTADLTLMIGSELMRLAIVYSGQQMTCDKLPVVL
ncbi:hypothetical protein Pcinc_015322 [Petrolisthes cinctipes]|uniref:FLYWCH-type domain-containing protein n=1 Tax=Petrolisthes cinctipes TaxID=88211 RepID=A0AAE1FUP7_PETCI|nr:hypothetical protein Pcinc_015322 [Petrolisthes cinctipes]